MSPSAARDAPAEPVRERWGSIAGTDAAPPSPARDRWSKAPAVDAEKKEEAVTERWGSISSGSGGDAKDDEVTERWGSSSKPKEDEEKPSSGRERSGSSSGRERSGSESKPKPPAPTALLKRPDESDPEKPAEGSSPADQAELMSKLAKERAEKRRSEEAKREADRKERAAARLRELEGRRRSNSEDRKQLTQPKTLLEPLGKPKAKAPAAATAGDGKEKLTILSPSSAGGRDEAAKSPAKAPPRERKAPANPWTKSDAARAPQGQGQASQQGQGQAPPSRPAPVDPAAAGGLPREERRVQFSSENETRSVPPPPPSQLPNGGQIKKGTGAGWKPATPGLGKMEAIEEERTVQSVDLHGPDSMDRGVDPSRRTERKLFDPSSGGMVKAPDKKEEPKKTPDWVSQLGEKRKGIVVARRPSEDEDDGGRKGKGKNKGKKNDKDGPSGGKDGGKQSESKDEKRGSKKDRSAGRSNSMTADDGEALAAARGSKPPATKESKKDKQKEKKKERKEKEAKAKDAKREGKENKKEGKGNKESRDGKSKENVYLKSPEKSNKDSNKKSKAEAAANGKAKDKPSPAPPAPVPEIKRVPPKRHPRTRGVRYTVDAETGGYLNTDACSPDNGYGSHRVPGGRVRNPRRQARQLAKREEKAAVEATRTNLPSGIPSDGFSFRNDPGFLEHSSREREAVDEERQRMLLEEAWASLEEKTSDGGGGRSGDEMAAALEISPVSLFILTFWKFCGRIR